MFKDISTGKQLRMRRLFTNGGLVMIPMDHGTSCEPSPPIRDLRQLVARIAKTRANGIVCTPGMLEYVAPVIGDLSVCLRMDAGPTRLTEGKVLEQIDFITTVESAVALGVDAVICCAYAGTSNEAQHTQRLGMLATECRKYGMPFIAEPLPSSVLSYHYGLAEKTASVEQINRDLAMVSRISAEMGADLVKTQYSGDKEGYRQVTDCTPVPVVLAGGPKGDGGDKDFLNMVEDAMAAGAKGVIIGRNVWLRDDPNEIINALCSIIHQ